MAKALARRKRIRYLGRMTKAERRGGAPRKVPDGLTRPLYVRCEPAFLARLDRYVDTVANAAEDSATPRLSRSDVVRELLTERLDQAGIVAPAPKRGRKSVAK